LQILKTIQYILAGLVLALGLFIGISLMAGASNMVENVLMPLQLLGGGAVSNLIAPVLTGFLINLGIAILIVALILSILFYTLGRMIGRSALLEARLARLEARPWNEIE
jgi:hypothetical protein